MKALRRGDDRGQRLQRLHHRAVVGGVDDRAGRVGDEVEQLGRRSLAVELGEVGEHAAAEADAGKGARAAP